MPYLDTRSESHLWLRDFQTQIQPNDTQRTTLIVAGVYVIIIAILWCVPLQFSVYEFEYDFFFLKACPLSEGDQ
jgi:hypothetical protein